MSKRLNWSEKFVGNLDNEKFICKTFDQQNYQARQIGLRVQTGCNLITMKKMGNFKIYKDEG